MSCGIQECDGRTKYSHHHHLTGGHVDTTPCTCPTPGAMAPSRQAQRSPQPTVAQLLDFAAAHPGRHTGNTEAAIREHFGIHYARYYLLLDRAIHTAAALEHDPVTTHRLLREEQTAARARAARTEGAH